MAGLTDNWRNGGCFPGLVVEISPEDNYQVGHCFMAGRLKAGDLAMAIEHSGDCFWRYRLIKENGIATVVDQSGRKLYKEIPESTFGAYTLGKPYKFQPTEREFHLLRAGESVFLSAEQNEAGAK